MNKRFKRSGFDKRIISYAKDLIDASDEVFEVNISAVGKNTDAIIIGRDHPYHRAESAIEPCVINYFF